MKYKRRPQYIEAIQFNGTSDQIIEWLHTLDIDVEKALEHFDFNPQIGLCEITHTTGRDLCWDKEVDPLTGEARAASYIAKFGDEFWALSAEKFEQDYELDAEL